MQDSPAVAIALAHIDAWSHHNWNKTRDLRQKIIEFGVKVLDVPDPHLYFQAPGGQVFRLVGIAEDLTKYERDV